jgi:Restriction endonuclease
MNGSGGSMPKRTNQFQQLVAYIYKRTAPLGAAVTESAMLREDGEGAEREIDILVEARLAGHDIKVAVECRDRARDETLEWIDGLSGKTSRLKLNKVVAVSSSGFSPGAQRKAADHNIDLLTAHEAATVDWASRVAAEAFKVLTHSHQLMRLGAFSKERTEIAYTEIDPGGQITHKDGRAEKLFPVLRHYFATRWQQRVGEMLDAKIAEKWQSYVDDPRPRYCEISVDDLGAEIILDGETIRIDRLVFGCGTIFNVESAPVNNFVLGPHMLSRFTAQLGDRNFRVSLITCDDGSTRDIQVEFAGSGGARVV